MAKSSTSWKPGQSGNPKGRPPGNIALSEMLSEILERKKGNRTRRALLAEKLVSLALDGNVQAIKFVFDHLLQYRRFQHDVELAERIRLLTGRLDEMEAAK